jgi:hypothetical protein
MQNFCGEFFCKIDSEILKIETTINSPICQAKQLSSYTEEKLNDLYNWVEKYDFKSIDEEIYFFKELKSRLTSKYIYYHKILEIESNAPTSSKKLKLKYYKSIINDCHIASKKDNDFYKYYRSGFTHYDHYYFTRNGTKQSINKHITRIFIDVKRCSLYDYNLAVIMANDKLIEYYEDRIENINKDSSTCNQSIKSNLNWTGSKVDLIELIYALQTSKSINGGTTDIKEIAISLGKVLNIEIEEGLYRAYLDIKSRKNQKTKFLKTLSENLNQKMIEEDN